MTDKVQKIREEIERLKSQLIKGACASQIAMETRCKEEAYNEVLAILDSLQKEPKFKTGDIIKPIDSCLGSPRTIVDVCDSWYVTDKGILDFEYEDNWELVEEPVSEDLEEEVHNFPLHYHGDIVTDEDGIHLCDINESKLLEIAHHFANWQKQQMIKDAFTAEVNWYENAVIMCQSLDGFIKEKGWHKGDKVKLILIKDE